MTGFLIKIVSDNKAGAMLRKDSWMKRKHAHTACLLEVVW